MSFRDVDSAQAAAAYINKLNQKWPTRFAIMDEITAQLRAMEVAQPTVLELCCGAGFLGNHLLNHLPHITYLGIDQSAPLLGAAMETLAPFQDKVTLLQADLNQEHWHREPPVTEVVAGDTRVHAIISMQSLHDLGGEAEVSRIYQLAYGLLPAGGLFINADLIVEPGKELPNNPGRLTIERHLALLAEYGYQDPACTLSSGGFGCILGKR